MKNAKGVDVDSRDLQVLIEGLRDYFDPEQDHLTYPPKLRRAMNRLALFMGADYPAMVSGLFALLREPLQDWWPGEVPSRFAGAEPLLAKSAEPPLMAGSLSSEALKFLARSV